jgi:hypothetical protein
MAEHGDAGFHFDQTLLGWRQVDCGAAEKMRREFAHARPRNQACGRKTEGTNAGGFSVRTFSNSEL